MDSNTENPTCAVAPNISHPKHDPSRELRDLENDYEVLDLKFGKSPPKRPSFWKVALLIMSICQLYQVLDRHPNNPYILGAPFVVVFILLMGFFWGRD